MWVVVMDYETAEIFAVSLEGWDETTSVEEYLTEDLSFSLSNCEWMVVHEKPELKYIKK